jgi:hypothetical protein
MKSFQQRYNDFTTALRIEALETIVSNGSKNVKGDLELYECPCIEYVDKHGFYCQYAIVSYSVENGNIRFITIENGDIGDEAVFSADDVDTRTIIQLSDLI